MPAARQERMEYRRLFETWDAKEGETFEDGWKNKLIWGDNKYVMSALLEKFAGKIDLIYIDPPFATGADFSFTTQIGDDDLPITKEQSIIEEKAYRDTWGKGIESYIEMMQERLILMKELLSEKGSIYVHCDWRVTAYIRLVLDEVFGKNNFQREIIWSFDTKSGYKSAVDNWIRSHDTILYYVKDSSSKRFNKQYEVYDEEYLKRFKKKDADGRLYRDDRGNGIKQYLDELKGVAVPDVWRDIKSFQQAATSAEYLGYPTQKREALLKRIIEASSNKGNLIADFFCGSGTTLAVAEKLGRRWIGCDLGRYAIHVTRKRLMEIENCKPFEVLNLGKYERQVWQDVSFNGNQQTVLYEYIAFILKLYGVEPISGFSNIHGKNCKALVHVGSVDAPVTIDEIIATLKECASTGVKELHVLGWEWEMGLHELIEKEAKREGVKLVLKLIPNEVMEAEAVRKGDVRFFDMAYLKTNIKTNGNHEATVELTDFVIPNTELIPDEVRDKIRKWSDFVDYWAVDFNFQCDTFMNQWTSYRTRQDRTLKLKSDPYIYEKPGKYRILVKVIDIFGIDTSQAFEIKVK